MLYPEEHSACRNYEREGSPSIECRRAEKGKRIESQFTENKIIFMLEGELAVSCGKCSTLLADGQMIVIPAGTPYIVRMLDDVKYLICRIRNNLHLCEEFSMEKLFEEGDMNEGDCKPLDFSLPMQLYVRTLEHYVEDGIRCQWFFEIKMKELMFILRNYYRKEELKQFFSPLLSNNIHFSDFIIKNHRNVKNVKEFAELANYSISGFEKRFKKVFHVSAYHWMKDQKAKEILHELHTSPKTFKEIGWDYGFTSPAQFNDFCKTHFGMTPGQIRSSAIKPEE